MPRWSRFEREQLLELRQRLGSQLTTCPQFPEVVGDRKLLRFLRGHDYDMDKVEGMVSKHLQWRIDNNVDAIRMNILHGGLDSPSKFPKADVILRLVPQIVLTPNAFDFKGSPITVEKYNFSPSEVLENIALEEYILFLIHCLEYKSMIVEQLSEEKDREFLKGLENDELRQRHLSNEEADDVLPPFGNLVGLCVIRDLEGLSWDHIGEKGREILRAILGVTSDNYPELMRKCFTINAPWIFNTIWFFVKAFLAPRTIEKVSLIGSGYMADLINEMGEESVPSLVGGVKDGDRYGLHSFSFDESFLCPGGHSEAIFISEVIEVHKKEVEEDSGECEEGQDNIASPEDSNPSPDSPSASNV